MKKNHFLARKDNKYSIRKYHVGAASILIGSILYMSNGSLAHAAEDTHNDTNIQKNEVTETKQEAQNQQKNENVNDTHNELNHEKELADPNVGKQKESINKNVLAEDNNNDKLTKDTNTKIVEQKTETSNDDAPKMEMPKYHIKEESQKPQNQKLENIDTVTKKEKNNDVIDETNSTSDTKGNPNVSDPITLPKEVPHKAINTKISIVKEVSKSNKTRKKRSLNRNSYEMITQNADDGYIQYRWYPVINGLTNEERGLMANGRYGDAETTARKKATMLWLLANFDFSESQRQEFKVQDMQSPNFGDDVYRWLDEAKKGNISAKPGTMNLGRRREMIISANNIILSNEGSYDRAIINFGSTKNFVNDSASQNGDTSDVADGFNLKPPYDKVVVSNTFYISPSEKEEIKKAIEAANDDLKFIQINVDSYGNAIGYVQNSAGETVMSSQLSASNILIERYLVEKKNYLDQLVNLVEHAKLINKDLYTAPSYNFFKSKVDNAVNLLKRSYNTTENNIPDILFVQRELQTALDNLALKPNMSELNAAINTAKAQGPYVDSDENDKAVKDAIAFGEGIAANTNNTQDVVNQARDRINNALRDRQQVKLALQEAENLVAEVENKNVSVSSYVISAIMDGLFTGNENNELAKLIQAFNDKKTQAQEKINTLPESKRASLQERLDRIPEIRVPDVNDADNNGIADNVDKLKETAETKVTEAEQADAAAKAKLNEANADGLINPTEKAELDRLSSEATSKKAKAQELVNNLPDAVKGNLPDRLNS
ncbi:hypothetical protein BU096_13740, partial [Staphylococcus xylosus]|uniref:GA-like domain-containing protein n=1 Tax=Staphylococcus xylosus TaxID=1288 RepID=UPI000D484D74